MRLLHLDEAGIFANEPRLCVAGVLIHGDFQSFDVERKLDELTIRHIPEPDREGFAFHSTDIFHGSGYFDRERRPRDTRLQILTNLASIIDKLHLPVVAGMYQKNDLNRRRNLDWLREWTERCVQRVRPQALAEGI
jgi:hypothetical protein